MKNVHCKWEDFRKCLECKEEMDMLGKVMDNIDIHLTNKWLDMANLFRVEEKALDQCLEELTKLLVHSEYLMRQVNKVFGDNLPERGALRLALSLVEEDLNRLDESSKKQKERLMAEYSANPCNKDDIPF